MRSDRNPILRCALGEGKSAGDARNASSTAKWTPIARVSGLPRTDQRPGNSAGTRIRRRSFPPSRQRLERGISAHCTP